MSITRVQRGTNAELIATAQALYPMNGDVLDMTPGAAQGFWKKHRPAGLVMVNSDPTLIVNGEITIRPIDFRRIPWPGETFDHAVFDPPYVAKGGHATSTIGEMNARYGMLHVEKNPQMQWDLQIVPGVQEAHRLLRRGGILWWKLQDYVTSGRVWWFTKMALGALDNIGFDLVDGFILDGKPGPQPTTDKCKACAGTGDLLEFVDDALTVPCLACDGTGAVPRRQLHARNAHSELLIARKR